MTKTHIRKIIHVDMDCFYAQVEMLERPELKEVPLAIGGLPGTRSVLCTSNYAARKFGVKSAMPTDYAVRLCPQLIVLQPNFHKYEKASEKIQSIFLKYSSKVETVSLDEAYLDVSEAPSATEIGKLIKDEIFNKTGLVASVGIAPNKYLAKIASDWKKPNGFFVIKPHEIESFVLNLPVKLIPGVGKKSQQILENLGVKTCLDLRRLSPEILALSFGKFSHELYQYCHGIDTREVIAHWERKSLSVESTFIKDICSEEELKLVLEDLYLEMNERLASHLRDEPFKKIKKVFIKIKYSNFKQSTCEETLLPFLYQEECFFRQASLDKFTTLLCNTLPRNETYCVRLIGLGVRFLTSDEVFSEQLSFLELCA